MSLLRPLSKPLNLEKRREQTAYMVAICSLGQVRVEHELVLVHQTLPIGHQVLFSAVTDTNIATARNYAVQDAIDQEFAYLMFWDDDILPRRRHSIINFVNCLDQNPQIDIVGGVYPVRREIPEPIVIKDRGGGVWWGFEDGKVHKVYMTGTGFTMYRLSSLQRIPDLPVVKVAEEGGMEIYAREYFTFKNNTSDDANLALMAAEHGLNWCVDGEIICNQIRLSDGFQYRIEEARRVVQ